MAILAQTQRAQHLFVVRTWQESSSVAPWDEWRGSVEHIPTGRRLYFTQMEQLHQFIAEHSGWSPDPGDERPAATRQD